MNTRLQNIKVYPEITAKLIRDLKVSKGLLKSLQRRISKTSVLSGLLRISFDRIIRSEYQVKYSKLCLKGLANTDIEHLTDFLQKELVHYSSKGVPESSNPFDIAMHTVRLEIISDCIQLLKSN